MRVRLLLPVCTYTYISIAEQAHEPRASEGQEVGDKACIIVHMQSANNPTDRSINVNSQSKPIESKPIPSTRHRQAGQGKGQMEPLYGHEAEAAEAAALQEQDGGAYQPPKPSKDGGLR